MHIAQKGASKQEAPTRIFVQKINISLYIGRQFQLFNNILYPMLKFSEDPQDFNNTGFQWILQPYQNHGR